MTQVGLNNYTTMQTLTQPQSIQEVSSEQKSAASAVTTPEKLVVLSDEGKALSKTDKAEQTAKDADKSFADKVESFAYGTLGMDHPDEVKAETDDSYTAGQYLKGALTVGGLLLAIV
jgi:hypothetical protein